MSKELLNRVGGLPVGDQVRFFNQLMVILNDRNSFYKYGMSKNDYNALPPEKVSRVEEILYKKMFGESNKSNVKN